jgi:Leucine-rich repeat (LRR) protein
MVRSGLMNLIAYGAQDVYLTGNHNGYFEKFRIYYKKHIINDIVTNIEILGYEFIEYVKINSDKLSIQNMFRKSYISIDCSNLSIKRLPKFHDLDTFAKLKYLNCSQNKLNTIKKLMYGKLIKLDCSYNLIQTIPYKMNSLEYFDFSNNRVVGKLDFINYPSLKYLLASSNQINEISNLPNKLIYLDLSNNLIDCIDNLPNSLEYLLVVQTRITKINLTSLTKLKYLDISINKLNNMDGLPNGLVYLNCSQCDINVLDNLPTSINILICVNNNLISLNMLPESIEYLDCDHNQITKLDDLPCNLINLICSHNKLVELDNLPSGLKYLDYSNNELLLESESDDMIKIKPNLPKSLQKIINKNNSNSNKDNSPQITFFKVQYNRFTNFISDNLCV